MLFWLNKLLAFQNSPDGLNLIGHQDRSADL